MTEEETIKQREYKANWYRKNNEKAKESARKSYAANIEKQRERGRKKYHANKEKYMESRRKRLGIIDSGRRRGVIQDKVFQYAKEVKGKRKCYLEKQYGLTLNQWDEIVKSQNGQCVICKRHFKNVPRSPVVDHNHQTGKVRGALCFRCNTALGSFSDNVQTLENAIYYLQNNLETQTE
jgi:hypothetical protein